MSEAVSKKVLLLEERYTSLFYDYKVQMQWAVLFVCSGGDEVTAAEPAVAAESDADSEPSRAGAADATRAEPGRSSSSSVSVSR